MSWDKEWEKVITSEDKKINLEYQNCNKDYLYDSRKEPNGTVDKWEDDH